MNQNSGKPKILAVDDNLINLELLCEFLGDHYEILCAGSGAEALQLAPGFCPNVILLDIMMPGIDGFETCRQLRQNPATATSKIIMVSAKTRTSDRLEGYEAGADDYLTKPFDDEELKAKVRVFIKLQSTEEIDRAKTKLLEVLQHSIRTPLSPIISNARELAAEVAPPDDLRREMANDIHASGNRLLRVLTKAEQLIQLRTGLYEFDFADVNLWRLVMDSLQREQVNCARIRANLMREAITRADAGLLRGVIDNLIDNALLHSGNAEVAIALEASGDAIDLTVSDEGPGVPPEIEASIFQPFSNPDSILFNQGDGLGLAIAHDVVTAHGGTLTLRKDTGASFSVKLPAAATSV